MEREEVKSSQLKSVGYNPAKEILEIEFASGASIYQYFAVPPQVYHDLMNAESVGRYFGQNVRGKFNYEKLPPPEAAEGVTA